MSTDSGVTTSPTVERLIGRVKWFNNKAGYGFITVTDGSHSGSDIFVHHSAIGVSNEQYRYLVQGEYVEFELSSVQSGNHQYQASVVSGIKGGKLMCETRNEYRVARAMQNSSSSSTSSQVQDTQVRAPRQRRAPAVRNTRVSDEGPREGDGKEWTLAKRSRGPSNAGDQKPRRGRPPRSKTQENSQSS